MKFLVLSSLAQDTGSFIRASDISENLKRRGISVKFVKPFFRSLPFKIDMFLSLPWYLWQSFSYPCDFVLCVKSYPNVMFPALLGKLRGSKTIIDTDDLSFAYSKGLWSSISKISQEFLIKSADYYTYHNPRLMDYLTKELGISKSKVYQLKQGVGSQFIDHKGNKENNRRLIKKLGLEGKKILVFTGHFDAACDLDAIIRAMSLVIKKFADVRLILLGEGEKRSEYRKLAQSLGISDYIVWPGLVDRQKLINYLDISDIALVYYKNRKANYFRSSLKLREYLALGKKTATNNIGELTCFKKFTYQSETNIKDFALQIEKLLKGYDDKRQLKARKFIKKYYSWIVLIEDFVNKLKE